MQNVSTSQLKQWIDTKEDMLLIDVLSEKDFGKRHIPGSINIPFNDNAMFMLEVEKHAMSKDKRIVVYCAHRQCDASQQAAQKLADAGYMNVLRYEEGVEGWFAKGQAAA